MRLPVWVASLMFLIGTALRADEAKPTAQGDARAAHLLAEAAKSRYTWSPDIATVEGSFTWDLDGQRGGGSFHASLQRPASYKINGDNGAKVPDDVKDHIESMIAHRRATTAAAANRAPAPAIIVVEDDQHGPLILTIGDRMQSTERVKDGRLVQVNRKMAGQRFTIDVTRFADAGEGRVYPADFTVTWWNAATGKRMQKQSYTTQGLYRVDGQMFPKAEKVVSDKGGKTSTLEIHYHNVSFGPVH